MTDSLFSGADKSWREHLDAAEELKEEKNFFQSMQEINAAFEKWEDTYLLQKSAPSDDEPASGSESEQAIVPAPATASVVPEKFEP